MLLVAGVVLAATSRIVRLGAADQGTQPTAQTSRRAYDLLAEGFGPGFNGPIPIVVDVNGDTRAPQAIHDRVQGLDGVASVRKPQLNDAGTVAIVFVTPTSAPQDEATDNLVAKLRGDVDPERDRRRERRRVRLGPDGRVQGHRRPHLQPDALFLLYIIGVTLIVLAMAFRSIVISATAAVTTILSAFIGFGVLGLMVQEGHLLGLTGLDRTGPIETFVPPIAFAILFGLSMDYMVFIMSRIREEHVHGLETRAAVEHGVAAIGRVVVAAALIMGTVFAAFILSADRIPKEFGLLLAVAILTDALVVRMTLVPAFLTLMGERSWYIPGGSTGCSRTSRSSRRTRESRAEASSPSRRSSRPARAECRAGAEPRLRPRPETSPWTSPGATPSDRSGSSARRSATGSRHPGRAPKVRPRPCSS